MSLSNKYGIPQDKINRLIRDGWISCSVSSYEEIYRRYLELKSQGSKHSIACQIAAERNCSDRHIEYVISKFE